LGNGITGRTIAMLAGSRGTDRLTDRLTTEKIIFYLNFEQYKEFKEKNLLVLVKSNASRMERKEGEDA
jgi:hypothetical protein